MSILERVLSIAALAHEGQLNKAGFPYVLHPIRVMLRLWSPEERILGVLHDVVEDTRITRDDLRAAGFSETVLEALDSVTRRDGENCEDSMARAASNRIGRAVKLADLEDNCDLARIAAPTERDLARIEKYRRAIAALRTMG